MAAVSSRLVRSRSGALDFGEDNSVLLLQELIDLVLAADRPVGLAVETKHPVRYAGLVEQRVVEMVRDYGLLGSRFDDNNRV